MRHTVTTGRANRTLTAVVRLALPFDSSAHVGATRAVVRKILHSRPYGPPSFRIFSHALRSGEMFVVPKGKEHKPYAASECKIMLIEPAGTTNTGDAPAGALTAPDDVWI